MSTTERVATFRFGNVKYFEIELNKTSGIYLAGEKLIGQLVVDLKEETVVRDIRVKVKGKLYVDYKEGDMNYWARMIYMDHEASVVGKLLAQEKSTVKVSAGRHKFPFIFPLHPRLPSSLEDSIGYVKYSVEGVVDKPWYKNVCTSRPFTVFTILDLNKVPTAVMPLEKRNEINVNPCCHPSGPISATFRIERCGLVPGEEIQFKANIINRSNSRINKSYINLEKIIIYKIEGHSRTNTQVVACVAECPSIEKGQSFTWENQTLTLPVVPPTSIGVNKVIDVKYVLQLNVVAGSTNVLQIPLQITIGNIPLDYTLSRLEVQALVALLLGERNREIQTESTDTQSSENDGDVASSNVPESRES